MKDICPKPRRHPMAKPIAPALPFLNPRISLSVKTSGLARITLPLVDGMTGVNKRPEKVRPKLCPK